MVPLGTPPRLPATATVPRRPSFVDAAPPVRPESRRSGSTVVVHPAFFNGEVALSNGVYYLQLPNGNVVGYYSYIPQDTRYIYHFDLGYEYTIDANDGSGGIYLYDFASGHWWYTSPSYPFPYLYDFTLNAVVYYFPDTHNAGHYTTNPRYFYNYGTNKIITIPSAPSQSVIRSDAQAMLSAGKVLGSGGYSAGSAPLGAMSVARHIRSRRFAQAANCNSIGSLGSNTVTDSTDQQGNETQTYTDFYDANCQQKERVAVLVYPPA